MNNEWLKLGFFAGLGGLIGWQLLGPNEKQQVADGWNQFLLELRSTQFALPLPEEQAPPLALPPALVQPESETVLSPEQNLAHTPDCQGIAIAQQPRPPVADSQWFSILLHPFIALVLGKRGSRKSGFGYWSLEQFRNRISTYAVGIPEAAAALLPDWIGTVQSLEDVPNRSMALLDEAHLAFHSRKSSNKANTDASKLLNISRHKELSLIIVTQEARQIDINIASSANVLVFKEPSMLQFEFERRELRSIAQKAAASFAVLNGSQRKRFNYVYAPDSDFQGMLENGLPTFWDNRLSKAFASGTGSAPARKPVKPSRAEKRNGPANCGRLAGR